MISSGSYNVADAEQSQHLIYTDTIVCNVWLLDSTNVAFRVDRNCRGQALLDLTFDYLELLERDFFGLVYNSSQTRDETIVKWLDPTKKIRKQFTDQLSFTFWFRVKFYLPDPSCLQEEFTRYQFLLQIRKDILEGRLPVRKSVAAQLAGLALQSELGDYNPDSCRPGYVSHFRFVQQQTSEFEVLASEWHRKSTSMLPAAADLEYLNIARQLDRYGVRMHEVSEGKEKNATISLGVSYAGIIALRSGQPGIQFPWDNVSTIRFFGKKFTVRLKAPVMTLLSTHGSTTALSRSSSTMNFATASGSTTSPSSPVHTYRFPSPASCKSFWQYCVACHAFFRVREPNENANFHRGSTRTSSMSTAISVTAAHQAVARVTSGLRRYFSLMRRGAASTTVSGPVAGVERTLSTLMELRRSSRIFDRSSSRFSSRRSHRHSGMTSTLGHSILQSPTLKSSDPSLTAEQQMDSTPVVALASAPGKSYAQVPPGSRPTGTAFGRSESSRQNTTRGRKMISPETSANKSQQPDRPERPTRFRSLKSGSPLMGTAMRESQKRAKGGSPTRGDNASPKSHYRSADVRVKQHKHPPDPKDEIAQSSDHSDHETVDFDQEDATRYWNFRRSQANQLRSNRSASKGGRSNYHDSTECPIGRQPHHPKDAVDLVAGPSMDTSLRGPSTVKMFGSRSSLTMSTQAKKSSDGLSVTHLKERDVDSRTQPTDVTNHDALSAFVRDPFHPGAPASDPREMDPHASDPGLVRIRIRADSHKRFGFNIRGGEDFRSPVIVSRVGQNMPADLCIPSLSEGDQIVSINGRLVAGHTHAEVIGLIRAAREDASGLLELMVKPGDYVTDALQEDTTVPDSGDAPPLPPRLSQTSSRQSASSVLERLSGSIRRVTKRDPGTPHSSNSLESTSTPLILSMLELEYGLADGSILTRFEQLPRKKPGFTMNASRLAGNVLKNRYRDISPYDQTRVILQQGSEDYINASFVSMDFPRAGFVVNYIAAQGPLPSTYGDFWQMCWEQHVSVVVMLTAVSERGRMKCHQYWPDLGQTLRFSTTCLPSVTNRSSNTLKASIDLQIQTTREEVTTDFAFREITLSTVSSQRRSEVAERRVTQLQYITWPDHGVPNNPSDLIAFVQKVREKRGSNPAPIIVHCSAGIGRTGVLITLETAWNLMEHGQPVKPLDLVQMMRAQRALLIQTTSQFQFVCETVLKVFHNEYAKGVLT